MRKYGHKNKFIFLLNVLLIACFLTTVPSSRSYALFDIGFETLPYTDESKKPKDKKCDLSAEEDKAIERKWWETPLQTVLDASVAVGNTVFTSVAGGAEKLMIVGMSLWLALFTLKIVGGLQESDPMENLTKIGGMMLKVGIAAALLNHRDFFFEYFIASVIQAGTGFVNTDALASEGGTAPPEIQMVGGGLDSVASALKTMADAIHDEIARVIGKANYLGCIGDIHKFSFAVGSVTFADPKVWLSSCVISFGAYCFMFLFPYFLLEACVRMGIMAAMCPLFIVAWVFPSTVDFAKKGWNMLLHITFTFMMIKIIVVIATKMMMGGSGLENIGMGDDEKKLAVCTFRWGYLGKKDVCEDVKVGETNGMFIYIACIVYGWLLLQKGNELAGYFSNATFSADSSWKATNAAAHMVQGAGHKAAKVTSKAAGAAVNRFKTHKDRAAARTYEKDQKAREEAAKGGKPYTPTKKELKKVDKAKKRLQKRGALSKDGKENGEVMSKLLENGKARTAMRQFERLHNATIGKLADKSNNKFIKKAFGSHNRYENMGEGYEERSDSQLQTLESVGIGARSVASSGSSSASTANTSASTASTSNTMNNVSNSNAGSGSTGGGASSKPVTGASVSKMADQVAFRSKGNANYYQATSEQAAAAQRINDVKRNALQNAGIRRDNVRAKEVQNAAVAQYLKTSAGQQDAKTLQDAMNSADRHERRGQSANTNGSSSNQSGSDQGSSANQSREFQDNAAQQRRAQTLTAVADQYEKNIENHQYADTPEGNAQKTYDQLRSEQIRQTAEIAQKRAMNPNFDNTQEGREANKEMQNTVDTLTQIRGEYNVNDDLLTAAWQTVEKGDSKK